MQTKFLVYFGTPAEALAQYDRDFPDDKDFNQMPLLKMSWWGEDEPDEPIVIERPRSLELSLVERKVKN